ncbi:unnamed protein product [Caretta caretta]
MIPSCKGYLYCQTLSNNPMAHVERLGDLETDDHYDSIRSMAFDLSNGPSNTSCQWHISGIATGKTCANTGIIYALV